MTFIPDLSPYTYTPSLFSNELAVGWIDAGADFSTGTLPRLLGRLVIERLTFAAAYLHSGTAALMGIHPCTLCDGPQKPLSNHALWGSGEFRVIDDEGTAFVSPTLIAHYIDAHAYLPPEVFIEAVAAGNFFEDAQPERHRGIVDRMDDASAELTARTGATAIVHGHVESWNRVPTPPILGVAVGRLWYGPWDGTLTHATALVASEAPLGFTSE